MFRKPLPKLAHEHQWSVSGVEVETTESGNTLTIVLYQCSCGIHNTEVISGEWTARNLGWVE